MIVRYRQRSCCGMLVCNPWLGGVLGRSTSELETAFSTMTHTSMLLTLARWIQNGRGIPTNTQLPMTHTLPTRK